MVMEAPLTRSFATTGVVLFSSSESLSAFSRARFVASFNLRIIFYNILLV